MIPKELNDSSVIMGGVEREPRGVPLMHILGRTIAEFSQLPKGRQPDDFPDNIAYFKSEDTLVMLRRRRPISYSPIYPPREGVGDGYFAEVFDMDKDSKPVNGVSNPAALDGLFRRIEVTDELDDPFAGSWLTPTVFRRIIRERLGKKMRNQPKALPSPGDEKKGVLGQLFAQKELKSVGQMENEGEGKSIREEIIKKYFREEGLMQGLNEEVGDSHFVITEDENSQLVQASRELGVETYVVKTDETWDSGSQNPIKKFVNELKSKDKCVKLPLFISVDAPSIIYKEHKGMLGYSKRLYTAKDRIFDYARSDFDRDRPLGNPLFSFVEWVDSTSDSSVVRHNNGYYYLRGNDAETAKKLIMKVGMDYLLTSEAREIARKVS